MLIYLQMLASEAEKSKFEQLYLGYRGMMLRVAMSILRNKQDAEDVVHMYSIFTELLAVYMIRLSRSIRRGGEAPKEKEGS